MNFPKVSVKRIVITILAVVAVIASIPILLFVSIFVRHDFVANLPYPDTDISGVKAGKLVKEIKQAGKPPRSLHTDITTVVERNIPLGSSKAFAKQMLLNNGFKVSEDTFRLDKDGLRLSAHRYPDGSELGHGNGHIECSYYISLEFKKNKLEEVGDAFIHCNGLQLP